MAEKFFLFKRADPSVQGGAVFSDNGKGISAVSFPAKNLSYMAADRGAIVMYFNESAPFEENSLTLAGESFEKTSITVSCELGKETDLMESIIDFINRNTASNVMKFDAIGGENTFSKITPSPVIDAKVRARPVERGLVGSEAIVTGLDANAVVNGIDFIRTANKPFIDFAGENISVADDVTIGLLSNSGTSGSDYDAIGFGSGGTPSPFCRAADGACKEKTVCFDFEGSLKLDVDMTANIDSTSNLDANLSDEPSSLVAVSRGGVGITPGATPSFTVSTDASGNVTDLRAVSSGRGLQAGDLILMGFETDGGVVYTVQASDFGYDFHSSVMLYVSSPFVPDVPFPLLDYVTYVVLVAPSGSLFQPLYSNNTGLTDLTETFVTNMGPFPASSMGNEFEVNHGQAPVYTTSIQSAVFPSIYDGFSYQREEDQNLTSEDNLYVFVVRRTSNRDIYIYSRDGDLIGTRLRNENDDDTKLELRNFGMVLPFNTRSPQLRVARFGIIQKDIGDLLCRNMAIQLYDHYKNPYS